MKNILQISSTVICASLGLAANAKVCDYTPSNLVGQSASTIGTAIVGVTAVASTEVPAAYGATVAILLEPVTIAAAAVTAVGVGAFEGVCYFQVERVTDVEAVHVILKDAASRDDTIELKRFNDGDGLVLKKSTGDANYLLKNLYIADGILMHRDWWLNTNLGTVFFTPEETN
ncbi:hypothetical protein [Pseudopelagicola sp. nBUS_19]|uniref:hypothetical protein n=1 Tax=unclassified Pseudopelagicola TaxID=2649563 RepID=UPI003EC0CA4C